MTDEVSRSPAEYEPIRADEAERVIVYDSDRERMPSVVRSLLESARIVGLDPREVLLSALADLDRESVASEHSRRVLGEQETPEPVQNPDDIAEYRAWQRASEAPTVYSAPLPTCPSCGSTDPNTYKRACAHRLWKDGERPDAFHRVSRQDTP